MHVGISGDRGADVDADRRRIDQLDMADAVRLDRKDMLGQLAAVENRVQRRH